MSGACRMDGGARLLVLAALALVSGGCAEERTPVEAAAVRDSAGIVLVENRLPLEELPTCGVDSTAEVRIGRQAGEERPALPGVRRGAADGWPHRRGEPGER